MKRLLLLIPLILILLACVATPVPRHGINEIPLQQAIIASDGDQSSQSITSFSQTISGDVMYHPDAFVSTITYSAVTTAYDGWMVEGDTATNDFTATQTKDGTYYEAKGINPVLIASNYYTLAEVGLNFSISDSNFGIDDSIVSLNVSVYHYLLGANNQPYQRGLYVYDWTSASWGYLIYQGASWGWSNTSIDLQKNPQYIYHDTSAGTYNVTFGSYTNYNYPNPCWADVDYAQVQFGLYNYTAFNDTAAAGSGYFCSFSDVSPWSGYATEAQDSMTTDGDVGTIVFHNDGNADYWQTAASLGVITGYYIEFSIEYNMSINVGAWILLTGGLYGSGGTSAQSGTISGGAANTWYPRKALITTTSSITGIAIYGAYGSSFTLKFDYLRISPSDEMGWSHDGSTTAGFREEALSGWSYGESSNGTATTLTFSRSGGSSSYGSIWLDFDTTATKCDLSRSYYPFFALNWQCSSFSATGLYADLFIGGYRAATAANWLGGYKTAAFTTETDRVNDAAFTSTDTRIGLRFVVSGSDGASATIVIGYAQAYGIANWTFSQSGNNDPEDYAYVSSGALITSSTLVYPEYMTFNRDPALSVDTSAYNVWNFSLGNTRSTYDNYKFQVGGVWEDHSATTDTRGAFSGTGTLTDLQYIVTSGQTLSSILFISDGTAPSILDKFSTPANPTPDDSVTITVVAQDTVDIYSVTLNAVAYPSGFSDIDYSASAQVSQSVYNYTFSSLSQGYYLFRITASDGANTATTYLPVTVIDVPLVVTSFMISSATETLEQATGRSNKVASYTVYENGSSVSTGTVGAGSFSFTWDKETASSVWVNVSVKFTSGSDTEWAYGSYSTGAATSFKVSAWWMTLQLNDIMSYVEFYAHTTFENGTIKAYDNSTLMTTVTEQAGGISSYFYMRQGTGFHIITLNMTSGSTTLTRQKTYYVPDWASTGLVGVFDMWTQQNNSTILYTKSNWGNTTVYVYLNSSLAASSGDDPAYINFTRSENAGFWNLTIKWDGGTQTYTIRNIRYRVTEEGTTYYSYGSATYDYRTFVTNYVTNTTGNATAEGIWTFTSMDIAVLVIGLNIFGLLMIFAARYLHLRELIKADNKRRFG